MEIVTIDDPDELFRRLHPLHHINSEGAVRSNAYKYSGRPVPQPSVDLAKLTSRDPSVNRAPNRAHSVIELIPDSDRGLELCDALAVKTYVLKLPDE